MPQFELMWERVHLYLVVRAWLQIRMNCSREVTTLFELKLGLRIEISIIGSDSYINHLTCSQFKLDDGSELTVSEVITCCASARGWIDTCHDLGRVSK